MERLASPKQSLEYFTVRLLIFLMGALPRRLARTIGAALGDFSLLLLPRLRAAGQINLRLAFPEWPQEQRERVLRNSVRNLGRQLAEFCRMSRYTRASITAIARCEGEEHYLAGQAQGQGTLVLTGHIGAWELSSFYHSLLGHPMALVIRRLDNLKVDALVNHIRGLHGNSVIHKDDFARGLLSAMRRNQTVGILMDTNMTPPQGVFAPFFGVEACTASGLARVALKTGATVLPGFMVWEESEQKYVLRFSAPLALARSGDDAADILANTAMFTRVIEDTIRRYPEQWLWVHRRWKTRPAGGPAIY
jgi:KDO2-lipid IV(A) lauroyltransferase